MTNRVARTHAYIISGGSYESRSIKALELGKQILADVGRVETPTTFTHLAATTNISRQRISTLLHDLSMTAFNGDYRILIIEQAEQLTPEAGNTLLKSLEEPPEHVVFILLAPTVARVMPTLRSRSQIVPLKSDMNLAETADSAVANFFTRDITQRFAHIAQLADRDEQLAFAFDLLRMSQQRKDFAFAMWFQDKLVAAQKSGNLRLLLETSAIHLGGQSRV